MSGLYQVFDDYLKIHVRLTPKAHKDLVEGVEISADDKPYLKARVRAVPEKGKANKALEALIASHFDLPKSAVKVVAGSTSRMKTVAMSGNVDLLKKRLSALAKAS